MKKGSILAILITAAILSIPGCRKKENIDLSGIHTSEAETSHKETMAGETTAAKAEAETNSTSSETTKANSVEALSVRSQIATYKDGKISIEYPILSNLRNNETEETVNTLIKEQAVKIISAYDLDKEKDTLSVKCETVSLDRSKAVFCFNGELDGDGSAYPVSVYYALTVDLTKGMLLKLSDYADPYTMAGYIISDDCIITEADDEKSASEYLKTLDLNALWELLKKSDFSSDNASFPETFSYVNNGIIYISIPVPHAMGDHILIEYHTEAK